MNKNCKYNLVGSVNLFGMIPDYVLPVFERNGNYYFQVSNLSGKIDTFVESSNTLKNCEINLLENSSLVNSFKNKYKVNDDAIIMYQMNEEKYFLGTFGEFSNFIDSQSTNDKDRIKIKIK